jgi:hypothetical protein
MPWHSIAHLPIQLLDPSTITLSWLVKVATIQQIRINHRRRSMEAHSWFLMVANLASFVSWVLSGIYHHNGGELWGQLPGIVLQLFIIYQAAIYYLLPKWGYKQNEDGHYHGRKECETCHINARILGMNRDIFPYRCGQPGCPSSAYTHLMLIGDPLPDDQTLEEGPKYRAQGYGKCDTCLYSEDPLHPIRRITHKSGQTYYLRYGDDPWRQVTFDKFMQFHADVSGGQVVGPNTRGFRLLVGFADAPRVFEGLVVADGGSPPSPLATSHGYLSFVLFTRAHAGIPAA